MVPAEGKALATQTIASQEVSGQVETVAATEQATQEMLAASGMLSSNAGTLRKDVESVIGQVRAA
jgi:hypothetical protein